MNKILVISFLSILIVFTACSQRKVAKVGQNEISDSALIIGKWRLESDSNVTIIFDGKNYVQTYGKDTLVKFQYSFCSACNLYNCGSDTTLKTKGTYILIYSKDLQIDQCNLILGLGNILSWMDQKNGKLFAFNRIGK